MKACVLCFMLVFNIQDNLASIISKDVLEEGHAIVKRFAKSNIEFTSHEVADVFYENEPGSFHRVSKRELKTLTENRDEQRIRLNVPSGLMLHLNLKKRSLFDTDTEFYTNTEKGQVKSESPATDCYASGNVDINGTSEGIAAVAFCNGLHGSATTKGVEYYFHPVDNTDGMHQVHVLKRDDSDSTTNEEFHSDILIPEFDAIKELKRSVDGNTYKTATGFVIEMAVFVDAHYYKQVHTIAPGREDEYVMMAMAAAQAMYDNEDKVGYDVVIKVKLFMNWKVDPQGYNFQESVGNNLREFCQETRDKYKYDMHFLYTGVINQKGPGVGMAYLNGVCTNIRCASGRSVDNYRYIVTAHEIGHNLGFNHHAEAKCPDEVKKFGDGFMGHINQFDFSSCNKWELEKLFMKGRGLCLFEETRKTLTSDKLYINIPSLFPGQIVSPDQRCRTIAGQGYTYYRPFDIDENGECYFFTCINLNKNSDDYLRVVRSNADMGYPCGDEMFCLSGNCHPWDKPNIGWDVDYLRNLKQNVSWSDWSQDWTACSNKCGAGVQFKQRTCNLKEDVFTNPYCRGPSVKARLCNETPCPGETSSISDIRQKRGDEICARFKKNNVVLPLKTNSTYLPVSQQAKIHDKAANYIQTRSCFLSCKRDPARSNDLDAIYPDGTPCTDTDKNSYSTKRFGIQLRCVQGVCTEFSDCPGNAKKDKCGVCGGDPTHCITKTITTNGNVFEGERQLLALIPAGSKNIDIEMVWYQNRGVTLELLNDKEQQIFGRNGLFKKYFYRDNNPVTFAGTKWTYSYTGYIRADGPTDQTLLALALPGEKPIKEITVTYLEPKQK